MADNIFHFVLGAGLLIYVVWMMIMLIITEKKMDELEKRSEKLMREMNEMNHRRMMRC